MTNFIPDIFRHEVLFAHALLSFIESKFPRAVFGDDLPGQSRTEAYFINDNEFYLLEIKSESESRKDPDYTYKSFLSTRKAIKALRIKGKYSKWLIYLAQLHDYTRARKRAKSAANYSKHHAMLGLPFCKLEDCRAAIAKASNKIDKPDPGFSCKHAKALNMAYILMEEQELATFIQNIKDAHLGR